MAGASYLLDTVIIAGYFNHDATILERLKTATVYVAAIAIGELYFGAYHSGKMAQNVDNIRKFAENTTILNCNAQTADQYGQIKKALREKRHPIPENDIWIAAVAVQHGLILATRDAHFRVVDNLTVDHW